MCIELHVKSILDVKASFKNYLVLVVYFEEVIRTMW